MFVRQNQQQFRNSNADVQIFYGSDASVSTRTRSWNKPTGVSHVYMMLIGGGGYGDPKKRRPEDCDYDVKQGFVSARLAGEAYGWPRSA